jgi:hypothetical protein
MAVKPSPAYLAENSSAPLYQTAVTFMVLQSIFVVLFYASRYINKTAYGVDFWCFIPLAYVFCMANCSISIGKLRMCSRRQSHRIMLSNTYQSESNMAERGATQRPSQWRTPTQ